MFHQMESTSFKIHSLVPSSGLIIHIAVLQFTFRFQPFSSTLSNIVLTSMPKGPLQIEGTRAECFLSMIRLYGPGRFMFSGKPHSGQTPPDMGEPQRGQFIVKPPFLDCDFLIIAGDSGQRVRQIMHRCPLSCFTQNDSPSRASRMAGSFSSASFSSFSTVSSRMYAA